MMNVSKPALAALLLLSLSCSPTKGRKALVVDDDGHSMRFENGRSESKSKRWDNDKSRKKRTKQRMKALKKRRKNY